MMLGLRNFVVQVRLHDETVVTFQQVLPEEVIAWPTRLLLILLVLLVSVAVLAALVRALTATDRWPTPPPNWAATFAAAAGRIRAVGSPSRRRRLQHHAGSADSLYRGSRPYPRRDVP